MSDKMEEIKEQRDCTGSLDEDNISWLIGQVERLQAAVNAALRECNRFSEMADSISAEASIAILRALDGEVKP